MSEFKSGVKQIQAPQGAVYDKISDLSNLEVLKQRMADPSMREQIASQMGQDKVEQFAQYLDNVSFDRDSITISGSPVGNVCLRIIEREEPKTINMQGEGSPIPLNLWIQLLHNVDVASALRVVIKAELNFFIKQMASKPLQKAADGIAEMLARIPY